MHAPSQSVEYHQSPRAASFVANLWPLCPGFVASAEARAEGKGGAVKYSKPFLRERGKGRWQARFRYKEGDRWKTLSRNIDTTSKRAATRGAAGSSAPPMAWRTATSRSASGSGPPLDCAARRSAGSGDAT